MGCRGRRASATPTLFCKKASFLMAYMEETGTVLVRPQAGSIRRYSTLERRNRRAGMLFILPSVVFVALFFIIPLIMTAWMSLYDWPLLGSSHFIGLENYHRLITDGMFWQSLWFTTKYTLVVTPCIFLPALGLALLIRLPRPGVGFFRTAFFLPVVVGLSTASILWVWMFNDQVGVFDGILQALKLINQPVEWLSDANSAFIAIIVMVVWKTVGATMLFLMIGMNAIPEDFYDAARVDGAGRWACLLYITLPLMRRMFALALILSVIGSYLAFDQFFIMTQGGPQNQTITTVYWIYNNSFTYYRLGYGAALSIVLLVILVILSAIQLYLLRDDTRY
jgi:multiple sugar transport system permease protein